MKFTLFLFRFYPTMRKHFFVDPKTIFLSDSDVILSQARHKHFVDDFVCFI